MKIICVSDTHTLYDRIKIDPCDILISAGDYSFRGEPYIVREFHEWMNRQPAKHKISVQGNHEKLVESAFAYSKDIAEKACPGVHFIDEGLVEVEGLRLWCSAITPFFCNWAWNRYPGDDIQKHWDRIPTDGTIDIIVTHGPVYGILDSLMQFNGKICEYEEVHLGCPQLLKKVLEVKPKAHIGGHIHPGYGTIVQDGIRFVNAALCDDSYRLVNKPIIFEI